VAPGAFQVAFKRVQLPAGKAPELLQPFCSLTLLWRCRPRTVALALCRESEKFTHIITYRTRRVRLLSELRSPRIYVSSAPLLDIRGGVGLRFLL